MLNQDQNVYIIAYIKRRRILQAQTAKGGHLFHNRGENVADRGNSIACFDAVADIAVPGACQESDYARTTCERHLLG